MNTVHVAHLLKSDPASHIVAVDNFLKKDENNHKKCLTYSEIHAAGNFLKHQNEIEAQEKVKSLRIQALDYTEAGKHQLALNLQLEIKNLMTNCRNAERK